MSFMPYAYNQSGHPFGQCKHFSQVEPFEKLWYIVMTYYAITQAIMCWHGNDMLTNHQWTHGNLKIILIFNSFINLISIIQLRADKMLTHGSLVNR